MIKFKSNLNSNYFIKLKKLKKFNFEFYIIKFKKL